MRPLLIAAVLTLAACSTPPEPAPTADSATEQTEAFCQAGVDWLSSSAILRVQHAAHTKDPKDLRAAFRQWAQPTRSLVNAMPEATVPAIKSALNHVNDTVQGIATRNLTHVDPRAMTDLKKVVLYVGEYCAGV